MGIILEKLREAKWLQKMRLNFIGKIGSWDVKGGDAGKEMGFRKSTGHFKEALHVLLHLLKKLWTCIVFFKLSASNFL